ncbi:hypothetical protein [Halostreptopolyspora alba]|uniref:Uncharacterized protein n=1 Tax=Halostreptopolyspora alba TaxID=2487137 RepID=A0A3N0EEP5_9ACTN|nr:hypothetical protein EFW17_06400 [Nocardiopsaceae bacterium YIM 96095]
MNEPSDDRTEERLRAVLRAEADSVKPSPEALNLIRARTERKRFAFSWLRPLLAVGAAAAIAGSVVIGAPQVREQVLPELFPASGTERQTQSEEQDDGGQAARETEPAPDETGSDEIEYPSKGETPPPNPGGEPPKADKTPDSAERTVACSELPSEPQDPSLTAKEDEDNDNRGCESEEDDTSGEDGGDDGSGQDDGGDDGSGGDESDGGDDTSGEDTGGDPSAEPQE